MPKIVDPKSILRVGGGSSPSTTVVNNLSSQVTIREGAYKASEISTTNPFGNYLEDNLQETVDELGGSIRKPPCLGFGAEVYSYDGRTSTISGIPDWGSYKQADTPIWERQSTISFAGNSVSSEDILASSEDAFLYNLSPSLSPTNNPATDPLFNVSDLVYLKGGGAGKLHLASQEGEAFSPNPGDPLSNRDLPLRNIITSAQNEGGFTISGFLFPADRGTVALLKWDDEGLNLSPANSVDTIKKRVFAAINLDGGIQGESIFVEGDITSFPSRRSGQYDLSEMQTGQYRSDLSNGLDPLPNPPLAPSETLGAVRLLKDGNAAYFGDGVAVVDPEKGQIPVLFGAFRWDSFSSAWANNGEASFLSYRMPMLKSYLGSDLLTPRDQRQRFFSPIRPSSSSDLFETAGNYVTLGETHYTHQVARYRHVVNFDEYAAQLDQAPLLGTFALVHFKTEDAFEKLVRDGIAPSQDDLWSISLLDYDLGENDRNVSAESSSYSDSGATLSATIPVDARSNPLIKPSILIKTRDVYDFAPLNDGGGNPNYFFAPVTDISGLFERGEGYYTTISGVKYILPTAPFSQTPPTGGVQYSRVFIEAHLPYVTINDSFYSDTGGTHEDNYRVPFNPLVFNASALTGESNLHNYFLNDAPTNDSGNISPSLQRIEITSAQLNPVDFIIQPTGDTGLCVFSEGVWTSLAVKDPAYHSDGLPLAQVLSSTPVEGSATPPSTKMLYHSARLISLTELTTTSDWYIYISHTAQSRGRGNAFSIFRYDEEGFRVYQKLNLGLNTLEEASLSSKQGVGGTYESYYVYRPSTSNAVTTNRIFIDATLKVSRGVRYYIEVHPSTSHVAGDLEITILSPLYRTFAGEEPAFTTYFNQCTLDLYSGAGLVYGTLGHELYDFKVLDQDTTFDFGDGNGPVLIDAEDHFDFNNSGFPEPALAHPYLPALVAANDFGEFVNDEPRIDGTQAPSYGNFTQDSLDVISIQGMSDPSNSTMFVKTWADVTQPLRRKPLSSLFTARKDTQERFLDESYRISGNFEGFDQVTDGLHRGWDTATVQGQLVGNDDPTGPIDFFVRDDSSTDLDVDSNHSLAGYLRNGRHWNRPEDSPFPLTINEAQVRALPPMQDSVLSLAKYGQPRRGMLSIPVEDYKDASYFPNATYAASWGDDLIATPIRYYDQPSALLFTQGAALSYMRAFDLAFSRSGAVEDVVGDTSFKMRVYGVEFHNHIHSVEDGVPLIISAKIPGVTPWLDCGMAKGFKAQNKESEGCVLSARQGVSVDEGVFFTELEIGFDGYLFENSAGEVTVLIGIGILNNALGQDLSQFGSTTSTRIQDRRGLVGIEVLRKSTGQNYDGDAVVYTLDIDLVGSLPSSTLPAISDSVTVNQVYYNLAFSLLLDPNAGQNQADNDHFILIEDRIPTLEEGFLSKTANYTSVGGTGDYEIVRSSEPDYTQINALGNNPLLNLSNFWRGYFQNVPPGDYIIIAQTDSDDNITPEMDISLRGFLGIPSISSSPLPNTVGYASLLLPGATGAPRVYSWDVSVNSSGVVSYSQTNNFVPFSDDDPYTQRIETISNTTGEVNIFVIDLTDNSLVNLTVGTNPNCSVHQDVATISAGTSYDDDAQGTYSVECDLLVGRNYKFVYESLSYGNSVQVALTTSYTFSEVLTQQAPHRYEHYAFVPRFGSIIYEYTASPVS